MKMKLNFCFLFVFLVMATAVYGQTSSFTYQGRLTDGATAANGTYQMTFALFDAVTAGTQQGSTITNNSVSVTNGVFSVNLDFSPATPFTTGANRWLEINVKKAADPGFTLLTPRQQITSSPYSIRTLSASASDSLSAACSGCVTDANVANGISYSKLSGAPTSLPPSGSAGGDLAGTYPLPTIANNSITSAKIVDGTIVNADISNTAAIATTKISGLGTLATVSPTGTANSTTFLRGDQTWATPSAGTQTQMFNSQFVSPVLTDAFGSLSTNALLALGGANGVTADNRSTYMPFAGTVTGLFVRDVYSGGSGTATHTVKLYKNGSATSMNVVLNLTTIGTVYAGSDVANTFTFSAGDTITVELLQSSTVPISQISITTVISH